MTTFNLKFTITDNEIRCKHCGHMINIEDKFLDFEVYFKLERGYRLQEKTTVKVHCSKCDSRMRFHLERGEIERIGHLQYEIKAEV